MGDSERSFYLVMPYSSKTSALFIIICISLHAAHTTDNLYRCQFGLRLMVIVKDNKCSQVGQPSPCWNKGRCVSTLLQVRYSTLIWCAVFTEKITRVMTI